VGLLTAVVAAKLESNQERIHNLSCYSHLELLTHTSIWLLTPRLGSIDTLLDNTTNTIPSAAQVTALGRAWRGAATSATTTSRSTLSTPRDPGKSARYLSGSRGAPPLLGRERGTPTAKCQPAE